MASKDLYEVLGVSKTATADDIRTAFRKLAREHHPDVNPGNPAAEERFKEINEANTVLSDPEKRQAYDQYGTTDGAPPQGPFFGGGGGGGLGDIFDMFFGEQSGARGGRRTSGVPGEDLRAEVNLVLKDVLDPQERTIRYRKPSKCESCKGSGVEGRGPAETCPTCKGAGAVNRVQQTFLGQIRTSVPCSNCNGQGVIIKNPCKTCRGQGLTRQEVEKEIKIPAGVADGQQMHVAGGGGDGLKGGQAGDLYVVLNVEEDDRFVRDGVHLQTGLEISFPQATLGDVLKFEGLSGDLDITVPAGTQPGTTFRIRGEGVPPLHGGTRGDLFVEVKVHVPTKLSEGEERLVRELAELFGENPRGSSGGFLGGFFKKK
ncbi:MAG: molecular chaperone DnaJ [Armatimonadetes bacterium]|nr:molecular chaperone DnaJ [Armatimonadota bacterium]